MNKLNTYHPTIVRNSLRLPLAIGLGAGLVTAITQAVYAQQATNEPVKLEKVVVTGSNIPTADTVGPSPVETISAVDIEKTGSQDVLQLLKKISTSFAGAGNVGQTLNNGGYGEANVALRNLPTLVLLDGRRLVGTPFSALSSGSSLVDLNTIPVSMIERIEVLKDGASSIYGSDAIGGVVNIIMKKGWNGVELSGRYGFATKSNVTEQRASIVAGTANDTTSFLAGASYYHADPLLAKDRAVASSGIQDLANLNLNPPSYISPSYPGRVDSFILAGSPFAIGAPGYNPAITTPVVDGKQYNSVAAYNAAHPGVYLPLSSTPLGAQLNAAGVGGYPLLNTTDFGSISIEKQDRREAFANVDHDLFDKKMQIFGSFLFSDNSSEGALAPSPVSSLGLLNIAVPANNPYNPFGIALGANGGAGSPRVRSRFVDTADRVFDSKSETYHFVAGLKGDLGGGYTYEGAYTYNRSDETQYTKNAINGAALNLALQPDFNADPSGKLSKLTDPVTGAAIPTYNIFALSGVGANSPATLNALRTTLFNTGTAEEWGVDGHINGTPFELPAGQVAFAVGGEFRHESLSLDSDGLTSQNLVPGLSFAGRFPGGSRDQGAGFAEVVIPVFSPTYNVTGLHSLEITTSGRVEQLTPGGNSAVPKVGVRWQPIDEQLTVRASYSEGFIAPTLYSLFGPTRISNPTITVAGSSGQIQSSLPTNPNLPPSTSENYTAGVVYSPKQIPGLTVSADFYHIVQDGIAYNPDANAMVASLNASGSASPWANGFSFSDGTHLTTTAPNQVTLANFGNLNIPSLPGASQRTDGIDFGANYSIPTDSYGKFDIWANANLLLSYYFQSGPSAPAYNYAGFYTDPQVISGYQGTLPDFIITTGLTWEFKNFTYSVSAKYIPEVIDPGDTFPTAGSPVNDYTVDGSIWKIPAYFTIDMQLAYEFDKGSADKKWFSGTKLAVGVNNITDEAPPFISSSSEDQTDKSTYDILGRFVYFEVSKKF